MGLFGKEVKGFWQFVRYALLSGLASVVEIGVFSLLNYWLLVPLKSIPVDQWIFHYEAMPKGIGLGGMLSTIIAYACAQVFNFFVQRKRTFASNTNPLFSGIAYTVMVAAVWLFQTYHVGVLSNVFIPIMGQTIGGALAVVLNMTIAFGIQYPLNKYVIMRKRKDKLTSKQTDSAVGSSDAEQSKEAVSPVAKDNAKNA